jgi:hypothetical protein
MSGLFAPQIIKMRNRYLQKNRYLGECEAAICG